VAAMNILLTGSVAYDYLMFFPGYFRDHILPDKLEQISLSFLVESMVRMRGVPHRTSPIHWLCSDSAAHLCHSRGGF